MIWVAVPWLRHKTYIDLVAKREEAGKERDTARFSRAALDIQENIEKLRRDFLSLRSFVQRRVDGPDEPEPEEESLSPEPVPGGWPR